MICPHCKVSVPSGKWNRTDIATDASWNYLIQHFHCVECHKLSIKFCGHIPQLVRFPSTNIPSNFNYNVEKKFFEEYLLPKSTPREPIPKDVEKIFVNDYDSAVKLLSIDANASAAYSRKVLQHYIERKLEIKKSDLKQEIKTLKELNRYPSDLIDMFDNIRHYGVFAVHAKTDKITGEIIEVDYDEAESLLDILEELFEYDYVRPARIKERNKKLQKKLKDSKSSQNEPK